MNPSIILAMVRLRLLRVVRDRSGLVWLLVMPMVFSVLMGNLMGGTTGGGAPAKPRFVVYDRGGRDAMAGLLAPLRDHERFQMVEIDTVPDPAAVRRAVETGRFAAALLVPEGYDRRLAAGDTVSLRLFVDGGRLSSQTVRTLLDEQVLGAGAEAAARSLVAAPGPDGAVPRGRAAAFDREAFDRLRREPRLSLAVTTLGRSVAGEDWGLTRTAQHVGPAYILFFMLMFMMVTAKELVRERRLRTLDRLAVSRASAADLVAGFFAGGLAVGLIQAALLLIMNSLVFHLDYGDSPLGLVLVVVLFAGFGAAASVLLGSVARSEAQADGLGTALTMTMGALGGLWWPLEAVPPFMQRIGEALPTGQAITAFHDLIGRGWGVAQLAPLLAGLAAWFAVTLLLAAWRLRRALS